MPQETQKVDVEISRVNQVGNRCLSDRVSRSQERNPVDKVEFYFEV
jgi:hypothetical protein